MARKQTIQLSIINIKTHPHTTEGYYKLFKKAFANKKISKIRGADYGMFGSMRDDSYSTDKLIYGTLYKFLSIDRNGKYLDLDSFKTVDPSETGETFPVPENLKPNLKELGYVFYPYKHRLFFDSMKIAPNTILLLIREIFKEKSIVQEFGTVDCNLEATTEAIQKIIAIPTITKLTIDFTRPNHDDLDGLEDRIAQRIDDQNIRKFHQNMTTTDKDGIKPDEETKGWMEIARANGKVSAEGYDGESRVVHSTDQHPIKERIKFDPDVELRSTSMIGFSMDLMKKYFKK
jgi:Domain of unknown function (DUF4747)